HQAVPVRQNLVVPSRPDSRLAGLEQGGAGGGQPLLARLIEQNGSGAPVEDGLAFPVAARAHVVGLLEEARLAAEQIVDFGRAPDVEAAFLALAVGVERR